MEIPPIFVENLGKAGKFSLIVAILLIAANHWNIALIQKPLLDFLYFYVLLNGISASPFVYLERRHKVTEKECPNCGERLIVIPQYKCPRCGKLKFEK